MIVAAHAQDKAVVVAIDKHVHHGRAVGPRVIPDDLGAVRFNGIAQAQVPTGPDDEDGEILVTRAVVVSVADPTLVCIAEDRAVVGDGRVVEGEWEAARPRDPRRPAKRVCTRAGPLHRAWIDEQLAVARWRRAGPGVERRACPGDGRHRGGDGPCARGTRRVMAGAPNVTLHGQPPTGTVPAYRGAAPGREGDASLRCGILTCLLVSRLGIATRRHISTARRIVAVIDWRESRQPSHGSPPSCARGRGDAPNVQPAQVERRRELVPAQRRLEPAGSGRPGITLAP